MNNIFKLRTDNELLEWDSQPVVTSGNENVDVLQVEFGPEWEFPGARYFASFFIDDPEKTVDIELDENRSCPIPKQMLAQEQTFHFGVWAEADEQKIKSSENKDYYVKQGARGTNNAGAGDSATVEAIEKILCENNVEGEDTVSKVANVVGSLTEIEKLIDESGVIEYDNSF